MKQKTLKRFRRLALVGAISTIVFLTAMLPITAMGKGVIYVQCS